LEEVGDKKAVISQICQGLRFLHEKNVIHRDLKPTNILISRPDGSWENKRRMKISDFDVSRVLKPHKRNFTKTKSSGSQGWTAPEMYKDARYTIASDIFSLGCVITFILSDGEHPFGSQDDRDFNIRKAEKPVIPTNIKDSSALDLINSMINFDPTARPTIQQIIQHPFFKKPTEALDYIRSTYELNKTNAEFVKALEVQTAHLFDSDWKLSLSAKVQQKLQTGTLTPYKGDSVLHLVKAIRDKYVHYGDLSKAEQSEFGICPEGYYEYWIHRFPSIVVHLWKVQLATKKICNPSNTKNNHSSSVDCDLSTESKAAAKPRHEVEVPNATENIGQNLNGNQHKKNMETVKVAPISRVFEDASLKPKNVSLLNGGDYQCSICNIKVPNSPINIEQHLNGNQHKKNMETSKVAGISKALEDASLKSKSNTLEPVYRCPICKINVPHSPHNIEQHKNGKIHKQILEAMKIEESRKVVEVVKKFKCNIVCSVCNATVTNNSSHIAAHNAGRKHLNALANLPMRSKFECI